jgi:hypothetical protein
MAQRRFEYVFDDDSERDKITFDFSDQNSERVCMSVEGNEAVVYANRAGFMVLAKLCLKLASAIWNKHLVNASLSDGTAYEPAMGENQSHDANVRARRSDGGIYRQVYPHDP